MEINTKDMQLFLKKLGYNDKITIQVLQDREGAVELNTQNFHSKKHVKAKYNDASHAKVSHCYSYSQITSRDTLKELVSAQKASRAIWIMVNQGNGKLNLPDSPNCISQRNVTHLLSCFIDTDNCPFKLVKHYLESTNLKPHLIVSTSKDRYHIYFLLDKNYPATSEYTSKWKAVQKALAHMSSPKNTKSGMDYSMHDISKVLRLPGFYHLKKDPYLVKIVKEYNHPKYSLEELFTKTKGKLFLNLKANTTGSKYEIPDTKTSKIKEGGRHQAIAEYISSRSNFVSKEDLLFSTYGFIQEKVENPKEFLNNGPRNEEVKRLVDNFTDYRNKEDLQHQKDQSLEILNADKQKDPFQLKDSFYFEAPGITGKIIKEICAKSRYPTPSFTFATVIAALGTLKARSYTTNQGHAPVNYFLCLGPTGIGKNYSQEVLAATFSKLGVSSLIDHEVRSNRGILRFMFNNGGHGLLMLDEAEGFLGSLYAKDAPPYIRGCKQLLLSLYTSNNNPEKTFGYLGNEKEGPIVLNYPRLNAIGFGVLHTLEDAFSLKTIKDGLLQRFMVLTHWSHRTVNPDFKPAVSLNGDIFDHLSHLRGEGDSEREAGIDLLTIQDLQDELTACSDPSRRKAIETEILKLQAKLRSACNVKRVVLPFTPKALNMWSKFNSSLDKKINIEVGKASGLEGLYTRGAEQVGRLACALADERIESSLVDYLITFVDSRIDALKEHVAENMDQGEPAKDRKELLHFIAKKIRSSGKSAITFGDISRSFKVRNFRQLRDLLQYTVDSGMLIHIENYRDPSASHGRKGDAYALGDVLN